MSAVYTQQGRESLFQGVCDLNWLIYHALLTLKDGIRVQREFGTPWGLASQEKSPGSWQGRVSEPGTHPTTPAREQDSHGGSQGRPASSSISGAGIDGPRLGWNGALCPWGRLLCGGWSPWI